jgi:TFIIF-interacting CTD phosphatase-like protein
MMTSAHDSENADPNKKVVLKKSQMNTLEIPNGRLKTGEHLTSNKFKAQTGNTEALNQSARGREIVTIEANVNPRSSSNPRENILPDMKPGRDYTLVLDLDETLVHYDHKHRHFKVRPYAIMFLREMCKYYEIVIFTAALKDYADSILNAMDKEGMISHRLYRNSTKYRNGAYQKDLSRLGRDLNKCLIIDNMEENFQC